MDNTKTLVTFEAPKELLKRFDKVVAARYTNRSALLREFMVREIDALDNFVTDKLEEVSDKG